MKIQNKSELIDLIKMIVESAGFKQKRKNEFTKTPSKKPEAIYSPKLPFQIFDFEDAIIRDCFILRNNQLLEKDIILCPIRAENTRTNFRSTAFTLNSLSSKCDEKYDYVGVLYRINEEGVTDNYDKTYIHSDFYNNLPNCKGMYTLETLEQGLIDCLNNSSKVEEEPIAVDDFEESSEYVNEEDFYESLD